MKKILFIDRDGTILIEPPDKQVDSLEKMEFYPGVIVNLHRIANELDFELVMVTNQDGLGTDSFPREKFWLVQNKMLKTLENEGISFHDVIIDRSFPEENAPTRKPGIGLLTRYTEGNTDLRNSFVIGDRLTDVQLAKNLGAKAILIGEKPNEDVELTTTDWREIYDFLRFPDRIAEVSRCTNETDISIHLNLDGSGKAQIETGIGFFNHMLELFAEHSQIDTILKVKGDLEIDEHHTVEDTAIVLGEALRTALGNKEGIERYGFILPMDESLAEVAIDFSGRAELVWNCDFKREKIGDMPTELFYHFFKSFADCARCSLHIKVEGVNEHHKIEAIFKAVARSIRMAVQRSRSSHRIPSTKGVL